jgi:putative Ca2+/H+ antiporter (TMEM165/GDT1 family)
MHSLLISTGVVALAEMGDKTQLLAFILAARFKKPIPIILGILVATIINHGLAGALGACPLDLFDWSITIFMLTPLAPLLDVLRTLTFCFLGGIIMYRDILFCC